MTRALTTGCLAAFVLVAGCEQKPAPVGSVVVEPSEIRLLYPGFSEYRLRWRPETPPAGRQGELRASVHLVGKKGAVLRTFDHPIDFEWSPGAERSSEQMLYQSALAPPLEVGTYELHVGLYDSAGNGWNVDSAGATVRVEASTQGFPAFYFSPEWQPIESGTDLQILGRQWLRADGVLRLGELTEPGTLWLQLAIPTAIEAEQLLELEADATVPEVVVHNSCGDLTDTLSGSGSHQLMLPIAPPADTAEPAECEISLDANYALIAVEDRVRRTVALESLAWRTN